MRTAVRHAALASWLLLVTGLLACPVTVVRAADPVVGSAVNTPAASAASPYLRQAAASAAASAAAAAAIAAQSQTGGVQKATSVPASTSPAPDIKIPDLTTPLPGGKKDIKPIDPSESKDPEFVKDSIKRLNVVKADDVTLDDLNAARQAVAKLDALIEIEKRLADLEKIRHERDEVANKALIAAIPASALTPPPMQMAERAPVREFTPPPPPMDVVQIEGSNNHYIALVKEGESTHAVRAGDRMADNSIVLSVSPRGLELQKNNATRLVQVKDVQSVFGSFP